MMRASHPSSAGASTGAFTGLLLATALLSACQTGQLSRLTGAPKPLRETQFLPAEGLERTQPADIAVAPIRNQSDAQDVPLELLREEFYLGLVDRLYSPLELDFVDERWSEASFGEGTPPDGHLVIAITEWNPSHLQSKGVLYASAELRLFEGPDATGSLLWGVALARAIDLNPGSGDTPPGFSRDLVPRAVRGFAREALELLPERDPVSAPR